MPNILCNSKHRCHSDIHLLFLNILLIISVKFWVFSTEILKCWVIRHTLVQTGHHSPKRSWFVRPQSPLVWLKEILKSLSKMWKYPSNQITVDVNRLCTLPPSSNWHLTVSDVQTLLCPAEVAVQADLSQLIGRLSCTAIWASLLRVASHNSQRQPAKSIWNNLRVDWNNWHKV